MLHIHSKTKLDVEWKPCTHKPTYQEYTILAEAAGVETVMGEMIGRPGDYLLRGTDGELYVITPEAFKRCYNAG